jgi:flagellar secretion chaperone FliS
MNIAAKYQTVQITTSSPGELLIKLYDGLFRFLNVARHGMTNGRRAQAGEAISRAHAIISELQMSLDHAQSPELCANLAALYDFSLRRITEANLKNDPQGIDDVMRVLSPVREAFTSVVRAGSAAPGSSK